MSEYRQDRTNGFWSIIAPERRKRPHGHETLPAAEELPPRYDANCPFCPGNEAELPLILAETKGERPPAWLTRVVPNKYPLIAAQDRSLASPHAAHAADHEVIIETPRHDADLPDLSLAEMEAVLATWHRRLAAAVARPGVATAFLFRNHGTGAGASLRHSHSQLIALPRLPPRQVHALSWSRRHYEQDGSCVICTEIGLERETGARVVEESERFLVLVPYAASYPLEQWIIPLRHTPSFTCLDKEELPDLSGLLQRSIGRLGRAAPGADYNLCIEPGSLDPDDAASVHWTMRIVPRLTTPGGFEMLSGLPVSAASPEEDARELRTCFETRD